MFLEFQTFLYKFLRIFHNFIQKHFMKFDISFVLIAYGCVEYYRILLNISMRISLNISPKYIPEIIFSNLCNPEFFDSDLKSNQILLKVIYRYNLQMIPIQYLQQSNLKIDSIL